MRQPTAIDLFAGAGGLTRGLIDAGFHVLGAVELDTLAAETYTLNFPRVHMWHLDIACLSTTEAMRALGLVPGQLDLLAGCPPCEGFSTIRTLNGHREKTDPRNDLVLQFIRFARRLNPKAILIENVPALAEDERIVRVRDSLENLGFNVVTAVVNAADYGVPQRRRRMLLSASRLDAAPVAEPEARRYTVREFIGGLPAAGVSGDPLHDHGERRSKQIADLIARIPRDGGGRLDLPTGAQLRCHQNFDGFHDVYGRMSWDDLAPTITGGCINPSKGRFLHPVEDRAITLREAATLQTFPPNHVFSLRRGKYAAAEMIGNALPPELVRRQATAIRRHLEEHLALGDTGSRHPSAHESWASSPAIRASMRSNRPRDTRPELAVRSALHASGLRFRKHTKPIPNVRCEADIAFPTERLAVFVDGCFWHGCPQHRSIPKTNSAWWRSKIEGNVARDEKNDRALRAAGWTVLRVWEHEPPETVVPTVRAMLDALRKRTKPGA